MSLTFPRKSTAALQLFCLTNAVDSILYQPAAVSVVAESRRLGFVIRARLKRLKRISSLVVTYLGL